MPAAALVVVEQRLLPVWLDAEPPQRHDGDSGVFAHRHLGDVFDLGAAHQPVVDQHQHVAQQRHDDNDA